MSPDQQFFVVTGLPATERDQFAQLLADETKAKRLNIATSRRNLFLTPTFTRGELNVVLEILSNEIGESLANGENVVVDGTFQDPEQRDLLVKLSKLYDVPITAVKYPAGHLGDRQHFSLTEVPSYLVFPKPTATGLSEVAKKLANERDIATLVMPSRSQSLLG